MSNLCTDPSCYAYGRYCRLHAGKKIREGEQKSEKDEKDEQKPIAHFSKKREKLQREYRKFVEDVIKENKGRCAVNSPVCAKKATGLNHKQKRTPANLMIRKNVTPACDACNEFLESHQDWAKEHGHHISRFEKTIA